MQCQCLFFVQQRGRVLVQRAGNGKFEFDRALVALWKRYELPIHVVSRLPKLKFSRVFSFDPRRG